MMGGQLISLEEETTEYGRNGEGLSIGEMHKIWCHYKFSTHGEQF